MSLLYLVTAGGMAFAQGTVSFLTRSSNGVDAVITYTNDFELGPIGNGAKPNPILDIQIDGYHWGGIYAKAALYGGTNGADATNLVFLGPAASFRSGSLAGYVAAGTNSTRYVPGVPAGSPATFQVRAWDCGAPGVNTYADAIAQAFTRPVYLGQSPLLTNIILGNSSNSAAPLLGLEPFNMVFQTLSNAVFPPEIMAHPQSQTVLAGTNVTLSVSVFGSPPLGYQWWFNGDILPGATSSNITFINVQPEHAGSYFVVITNMWGGGISSVAELTVLVPPTITLQPQHQLVFPGASTYFRVRVEGTAPLFYQWHFNGVPIPGAHSDVLSLPLVMDTNEGLYSVTITNEAGAVTSQLAMLMVMQTPYVLTNPQSQTNVAGTDAVFDVVVRGTGPLHYQWFHNTLPIPGATNQSLVLRNVQITNEGSYTVLVTNSLGAVTSQVATLTVWMPPRITRQPESQTVLEGTNLTLRVEVTSPMPVWYQWYYRSLPIEDATNDFLELTNFLTSQEGPYLVLVNYSAGVVTSAVANITVRAPPIIQVEPPDLTAIAGRDVNWSVSVRGIEPLYYHWHFNQQLFAITTNGLLQLTNVQPSNAGSYRIVITNLAGAVTSRVATLTVLLPPSIQMQPQSRGVVLGSNLTLQVSATGSEPLSYQWLFNDLLMPGQNAGVLFLPNITREQGGSYSVVISNAAGVVTSALAVVTVLVPPVIVAQPQSQAIFPGSNVTFSVSTIGTLPLTYQWWFAGTNRLPSSSNTLTIEQVQAAHTGVYHVVVSNLAGSVTSAPAVLQFKYLLIKAQGEVLSDPIHTFAGPTEIELITAFTNGRIYYTTNDAAPTFDSIPYLAPFTVQQSLTLRAIAYSADLATWEEAAPVNIVIAAFPMRSLCASSPGGGVVHKTPDASAYTNGTLVSLTVTANPGWTFMGWSGDAVGTDPVTQIAMTRDKCVQAIFGTTLTLTNVGEGTNVCSPQLSLYPYGTAVQLTAIPSASSYFAVWLGEAAGLDNPCTLTITNPNPTITSLFWALATNEYALTVQAVGKGRALVTPAGHRFAQDQVVALTAVPEPGQYFLGWSGHVSGTNPNPVLNLDANKSVIAHFTSRPQQETWYCQGKSNPSLFQWLIRGNIGESYAIFQTTDLFPMTNLFQTTNLVQTTNVYQASNLLPTTNVVDWIFLRQVRNYFGSAWLTEPHSTGVTQQFFRIELVP